MEPRKHSKGCCSILRIVVLRPATFNMVSGEMKSDGTEHVVTEACNTPLFQDASIGVCRACRTGWEVDGNKFASDAERAKAAKLLQPDDHAMNERLAKLMERQRAEGLIK